MSCQLTTWATVTEDYSSWEEDDGSDAESPDDKKPKKAKGQKKEEMSVVKTEPDAEPTNAKIKQKPTPQSQSKPSTAAKKSSGARKDSSNLMSYFGKK
jgi:hypothetical protein